MSRRLRWPRLREVIVFTLPVFLAGLWLIAISVADYSRMRNFNDWWSAPARIDHFVWWRVRAALRLPRAMALDAQLSVEDRSRPLLDLRVSRDEFDRVANDPVAHAGESVEAWLALDETLIQEFDLKLRGDTSVHWTGEKKTLALKAGRGEAFQGALLNVFSAKEVLPQQAANSLAADFDLLAPQSAVLPVYLNKRFFGMFRHFSPIDEGFAASAGLLPGNIFRGDTAERGDYFKGLPRELFVNPYIWDRVALNEARADSGMARLFELVARVQSAGSGELLGEAPAGQDALSELFQLVDRDELARLLALDLVVGDPWHTSGVHNHFWYEDPSDGRLHPIPWDLRMLRLEQPPPGANFNRLWRAALRDPELFASALAQVRARNADGKLLAVVSERMNTLWKRYEKGFEYDLLRCGPVGSAPNPELGSPAQVLDSLRANLDLLERWSHEARASLALNTIGPGEAIVDVIVDGRAGVELWALQLEPTSKAGLSARWEGGAARAPLDRDLPLVAEGQRLRLATPERLLPGVRARERLEPQALHYRFVLRFEGQAPQPSDFLLRNTLTGEPVIATALAAGSVVPANSSAHPWRLPAAPSASAIHAWSGELRLSASQSIGPAAAGANAGALVIAAGTRVTLDPEVSLRIAARVEARGTAEQPIVFAAADPRRPWGSLLLLGAAANGSVFEHVRFEGGGGAIVEGLHCSGMLCVHGAREVRLEHCEFTNNLRSEDALHAAGAGIALKHCSFQATNANALRLEQSDAALENCRVSGAGRNGLSVEGGSLLLRNSELRQCAASGVSIGGSGRALVINCTINGCASGVEARDGAEPWIVNNSIEANGTAILARLAGEHARRGGWPRVLRTPLEANTIDVDTDKQSAITLLESSRGADDAAVPDDSQLAWFRAHSGWSMPAGALGAAEGLTPAMPLAALAQEQFSERWLAPESIWKRPGSVNSLRVERDTLAVRMGRSAGGLARAVHWDLSDPARENWLVLEAASTGMKWARVRVASRASGAELSAALELPGGSDARFAYTVLPLPAGVYESLAIEVMPYDATAKLCLAGWRVLSAPRRAER